MTTWSQHDLHKNMHVYSSDNSELGHVEEVYEDSFVVHKGLLSQNRYIPYSAIASIEQNRVQLAMTAAVFNEKEWTIRPDYEDHPGDPTQLMYDRGHGVRDPFDETNPDKPE